MVEALLAADPVDLGMRIKTARLAAGLTQPQLGADYVSVAYVSRIEKGQRRPPAALLEAFAARLAVTVEQLVPGLDAGDGVSQAIELELELAELDLAGGNADAALARVARLVDDPQTSRARNGRLRAQYVHAAACDSLGLPEAASAYERVVGGDALGVFALKACTALSRIQREAGDFNGAVASAEEGLRIAAEKKLAQTEDAIRLSVTLAAALYERGDVEQSAAVCRQAVEDAERLASPSARAAAYWNTSVLEAEAGNTDRALHLAQKALRLLEATDGVRDLARLRTQLSTIMLRAEKPNLTDAREQLDQANRELDWSGAAPVDRGRNDLVTARWHLLNGEHEAAKELAQAALDQAGENLPLLRTSALALLGQVCAAMSDSRGARRHFRAAIKILTAVGNDRETAQLWFELGTLADDAGLAEAARDAYRNAASLSGLA
ncbi:MAG: helix-turn-helix domain-containing protein [Actinomycetia bacterium]|nr:helix-turn-helix domain-containing protein [Actinomycetes bacterium]